MLLVAETGVVISADELATIRDLKADIAKAVTGFVLVM